MPLIDLAAAQRVDQDVVGNAGNNGHNDNEPTITALTDGGYAVAWVQYEDDGGYRIFVRKFDAAGNPLTDQIRIESVYAPLSQLSMSRPSIAAIADGGFVVGYYDQTRVSGPSPNVSAYMAATFDGASTLLSRVEKSPPATSFDGDIATNSGGTPHVLYHVLSNNIPSGIYANGQFVTGNANSFSGDIADFGDGYIVAYEQYSNITGVDIWATIIRPGFDPTHFQVTQTGGAQIFGNATQNVVELTNGGFVVVWTDTSGTNENGYGIRARIYDSAGSPISGSEILVNTSVVQDQSEAEVTALAGGRFLVTWFDGGDGIFKAQVFSDLGERLGGEKNIAAGAAPSVTQLSNGDIIFAWVQGFSIQTQRYSYTTALDGNELNNLLDGTSDNETLSGFAGNDTLNAAGGNDVLIGGADNDLLNGGDGNDTASYSDASGGVIVSLALATAQDVGGGLGIDTLSEIENLIGSAFNDVLIGDGAANQLDGNSGADSLSGDAGNDVLSGGTGNDSLNGGDGNDTLQGGDDADSITGGNDDDLIDGGIGDDTLNGDNGGDSVAGDAGNDLINGGDGNDTLNGGDDEDLINAGNQNDVIDGGLGNDVINGELGNDFIDGNLGNDTIDGGDGNDVLNGGDGNDSIIGGNGNETIDGAGGNDTINGGAGSDSIDGGTGRDRMTGGTGNDFYTVDDAGDVIIELAGEGTADTVNTTLASLTIAANVERLNYTGSGNFVGIGNSGFNRFTGGLKDDRFVDILGGNDTVSGGNGSDSMDFRTSATGVILDFVTNIHGGAAAGDLYASIEKYFGSNTADDIMTGGGTGRFVFTGGGGNDTLTGGNNIDNLQGQAGDDSISGLGGVDSLDGGAGNDTLTGGAAKDYFIYSAAGFGQDIITDFEDGLDKLKVHSSIANNFSAFNITNNGTTSVVLTQITSPTNTMTLNSASAITITAADFLFY